MHGQWRQHAHTSENQIHSASEVPQQVKKLVTQAWQPECDPQNLYKVEEEIQFHKVVL